MIHENELVMLLLCLGVVIFTVLNGKKLKKFLKWKLLFTAFLFFSAACLFTILEEFVMNSLFNYMEHICYAVSAILLTVWCYTALIREKVKND